MNTGPETVFRTTAELTDAVIEASKKLIGTEIRTEGWNQQASRDAIRHYAHGLGDDNPLFCDVDYGRMTRYGSIIAPPTFLYTISDAAISPGLPGIQPIYGGARWRWSRPVKLDERLTSLAMLEDVIEVRGGRRAPRLLIQRGKVTYFGEDGAPVGQVVSDTLRIPRATTESGLRYERRQEHRYTDEQLADIERQALSEQRRGAGPRFWEDVSVGEETPAVVKGPINQFTMTAYYAGCVGSPGYKACEIAWKYRKWAREAPERLPDQYDPSYFAEYMSPSMGHQSATVAREIGMPGAYDNGPQRVGWAANMLTNWCGDDGFVRALDLQLREAEIFGDTVWFRGRVAGLRESEAGDGLVDVDVWSENQLGQSTARGTAVVELPRRSRRR